MATTDSHLIKKLHDIERRLDAAQGGLTIGTVVAVPNPDGPGGISIALLSDVTNVIDNVPVLGNYIPEVGHQVLVLNGLAPVAVATVAPVPAAAPSKVIGLTVLAGVGDLVISWTASADPNVRWNRGHYEVQVDTSPTFASDNLQWIATAATGKTVSSLSNATPYFVRVRAINYLGAPGDWSDVVQGSPSVVTLNRAIGSDQIATAAIDDPRLLNAFTSVEGQNLLVNGDFAVGTSGWTLVNGTLAQDFTVTRPASGDLQSGKLTSTASGDVTMLSDGVPIIAGATYVARVAARTAVIPQRHVTIQLLFFAADGVTATGGSDSISSSDNTLIEQWMVYNSRGIAPVDGIAKAYITVVNPAAGEVFNVASIELRRASHMVGELRTSETGPRVEAGVHLGFPSVAVYSEEDGEMRPSMISSQVDTADGFDSVNTPLLSILGPGFDAEGVAAPTAELQLRSIDHLLGTAVPAEIRHLASVHNFTSQTADGRMRIVVDGFSPMVVQQDHKTVRHATVDTVISYPSNAVAVADIDATFLRCGVTVPASGIVEVRRTALIATSAAGAMYWGLRDVVAPNTVVPQGTEQVWDSTATAVGAAVRITSVVRITGLTPGSGHTWSWTWNSSGAGPALNMYHGPNYGPIEISSWGVYS